MKENNIKNISENQRKHLDERVSVIPNLEVRWSEERGVASLIKGNLIPWKAIKDPKNILKVFLKQYGVLVGPQDVIENTVEIPNRRKKGYYRVKGYQKFKGVPIYGSTVLIFANEEKGVFRAQSSFWRDVQVTEDIKLDEKNLEDLLRNRLGSEGKQVKHLDLPLVSKPKIYLYPIKQGFHYAYNVWAYQPVAWLGVDGQPRQTVELVEMMIDATTRRIIWEEPSKEGMSYTNTTGDGLSTLQDNSGNYLVRTLNIVRQTGGNYFLINRTTTPNIITHDAGGDSSNLGTRLDGDQDISEDADSHWNQTTTSCTNANREASQQPEVDGHFNAEETLDFYHTLGYDGFDDGQYGSHCPVRVVAHIGMDANAFFEKYSKWDANLNMNKFYGYIAFYDGKCSGTVLQYDFMAGDPVIFGHEYQHAITFFGAAKSTGEPGHLYGNDWLGAIREGFSDSFGCLRRGLWINPLNWRDGAIRSGKPFRRIEYPRSTDTSSGDWYCDHYDDCDATKNKYFHSTILSHLAYLIGQGGINHRTSRTAEHIPVKSIGLHKTAEIFLYALTEYYDTIPTTLTEETLIEAGNYLLDAAEQVSGSTRSCEYTMMRRALYAVGLYPYNTSYIKQTYGGEICMIPWTIDWKYSQPYLGFPALWYKSPDLFVNNNGSATYEAVIGQENKLFARVRNIGDADVAGVRVRFLYRQHGTNLPADMIQWKTCQDQNGVDCVLDIPNLPAGQMNFTDPDNPPANQGVEWYLDPSMVTDDVDHFCLRAMIEFTGDTPQNNDNDCPNYVQSNVSHLEVDDGDKLTFAFYVHNWEDKKAPLDLRIEHTLPKIYRMKLKATLPLEKIVLEYGKRQVVELGVAVPKQLPKIMLEPYDGSLLGKVYGDISGPFRGELSRVESRKSIISKQKILNIQGTVSGKIGKIANIVGRFYGELDVETGLASGRIKGAVFYRGGKVLNDAELGIEGVLEPLRAIHVTQYIGDNPKGGITLHLKHRQKKSAKLEKIHKMLTSPLIDIG